MSKIAIVGHPASGYREVETVLRQHGMGEALPSRRDGLSPLQITATLCKAHRTPPLDAVVDEEDIRQIDAGAVWHGMALDLMLGNIDQPLWGWADPQAIYTLDYWSGLDPQMSFVLVFDEPHRVLMEAARAEGGCPPTESLPHMLNNWAAYNGALLRFHLRHPGRCLLVHAQQTQRSTNSYLRQLQDLLDAPLTSVTDETGGWAPELIENAEHGATAASSSVSAVLSQIVETDHLKLEDISAAVNARATERYLADGVLADYPKAMQLYAELQSVASLPLDKAARAAASATAAWETWIRQRAFVFDLVSNMHAEYRVTSDVLAAARQKNAALIEAQRQIEFKQTETSQENELLLSQLHRVQEELERHYLENQRLKKQAEDKDTELTKTRQQVETQQTESSKKNELLQSQLRQAQEELKRHQTENQQLKKKAEDQNTALTQAHQQAESKQTEICQENELLLSQLHRVQEELERYYIENQNLKKKISPPKPPGPFGAAERIKKQLSYRLGAVMISRHDSLGGWLTIPWALIAEARAFRKECRASGNVELPPIHTYRDASEADRVKQHLSYRLGDVFIRHIKSPSKWFTMPFALQREVREFRRMRKAASK